MSTVCVCVGVWVVGHKIDKNRVHRLSKVHISTGSFKEKEETFLEDGLTWK